MRLEEMNIEEFIELLGSAAPAPGGGAAAALTASIGIALSEMVCSLSLGNKKFADNIDKITDWKNCARSLAVKALSGMEEDAAAYKQVNAAYKLPRDTEEEKTRRETEIQKMLIVGAMPPLHLMETALKCLELTSELVGNTTRMAVSDLGVAASNLEAAIKGAYLNVLININSLKDDNKRKEIAASAEDIMSKSRALSEEIYDKVLALL